MGLAAEVIPFQEITRGLTSVLLAVGIGGLTGYGVGELLWRSSWRVALAGWAVLALAAYAVLSGRIGSSLVLWFVVALVASAWSWYVWRLPRPRRGASGPVRRTASTAARRR